jgi:hypothetical protein
MDDVVKLATIECAICSALIEVFRRYEPETTVIVWSTQDDRPCERGPVVRCPRAHAEVRLRFPEVDDIGITDDVDRRDQMK